MDTCVLLTDWLALPVCVRVSSWLSDAVALWDEDAACESVCELLAVIDWVGEEVCDGVSDTD